MRSECIDAVQQAIGRAITQAEAKGIVNRLTNAQRQLARQDPAAWRALSQSDRLRQAGDLAAQELVAEAAKAKQRVALTILKHDQNLNRYNELVAGGMRPFSALGKMLENADAYVKGLAKQTFSELLDTIEAASPKFFGMVEDSAFARDFVKEVYGEQSGNASAAKAAKVWLDVSEGLRARFNRAGGEVGKLDYGYVPQPHDAIRIVKSGMEKWIKDTLPQLDRRRYFNEDGTAMDDVQLTEFLRNSYLSITTGGLNKMEPGGATGGTGMMAKRHAEARQIHFKNADAWMAYQSLYGKGSLFTALQGHVGVMTRDIALTESFGPNPERMFKLLHDTATKTGDSDHVGGIALVRTVHMWDALAGKNGLLVHNPVAAYFADIMQGLRNIEVFGKLGGAFISSINDIATLMHTARVNNIPLLHVAGELVRSFGSESKEFANRSGLIADSLVSDMNRWAEGNIGQGWTGKVANATMKASFLEGWTDAVRRAYGISQMGAFGKLIKTDWDKLHANDRGRLESKGINYADWRYYQLAKPEDWNGSKMLTPKAVQAVDHVAAGVTRRDADMALTKMMGFIADEAEYASLGQDLVTRAALTRGTKRGTIEGEFFRTIALFKGFPIAMMSRHFGRALEMGGYSGAKYAATLFVSTTMLGAISMQMQDLLAGKDPRNMNPASGEHGAKFWMAAMMKGGGLGFYGDMVYQFSGGGRSQSGIGTAAKVGGGLLGPVFGSAFELADATIGNIPAAVQGKDTHMGAELFGWSRSHVPLINVWYVKSVLNHLILDDVQEYLSPGYRSKVRSRMHKDWGQDYWSQPGRMAPDRAPDFNNMVGK